MLSWWLNGKESACDAGDLGSIPGESPWTEVPGGLHAVHWVPQSWTRLKQLNSSSHKSGLFREQYQWDGDVFIER